MIYQNGHLWVLFLVIPILAVIYYAGYFYRRVLLRRFADRIRFAALMPNLSMTRRFWKQVLLFLGLLFLIYAMLRPQFGLMYEHVMRRGVDVVIAVDVSVSMLAEDVNPSRFEHARQEIISLLDQLRGDRVGLVAFSGSAIIQCPLTLDYGAVRLFLDDIQVGMLPTPGTNFSAALQETMRVFRQTKDDKIVILISDGENFEHNPIPLAKEFKAKGIRIYTMGIGSQTGEPLPVKNERGEISLKHDYEGAVVLSKLNESLLLQLAQETGGNYYAVTGSDLMMDRVYKDLAAFEKQSLEQRLYKKHKERYQIFLFIAFCFLFLELMVGERKRESTVWRGRI